MHTDQDALICDLAETYHIYDMRALPVLTLARLSCGLGINSRIRMKMRNAAIPFETMVLVAIFDDIRWLRWAKTRDAQKHRNAPESLLAKILDQDTKSNVLTFKTSEEFRKKWAEINKGE